MFSILGIDPGTNYLGLTFLYVDKESLEIKDIKSYSINISNVKPYNVLNNRIQYAIKALYRRVNFLIDEHKPIAMSIENPFSYGKSPGSIIPLAKAVGIMEHIFTVRDETKYLRRVSPTQVKKFIGAMKNSGDKDLIYEGLKKVKEIKPFIILEEMTEDQRDSLAISLELLQAIRDNIYILL